MIIHSSPYLRCVQTSIAICAGLRPLYNSGRTRHNSKPRGLRAGVAHLHRPEYLKTHKLPAIAEPEEESGTRAPKSQQSAAATKTRLRLDAFLGEWLTPDYYEQITPPPGSIMMIAGAKADLLRQAAPIDTVDDSSPCQGNFPGGWKSGRNGGDESAVEEEGPRAEMTSPAQTLVRHDRSSSHGSLGAAGNRSTAGHRTGVDTGQGYQAPVPRYAISSSDPIPVGHVADACDACVDVDYQWDSMRPPADCGTGGDYGEEWSAMHRRFRHGLQQLLSWYRQHEGPDGPVGDPVDDAIDTVLVLVTHGAGCNALIGALTNQPVLLDVGMASLTMAVRRGADPPIPGSATVPWPPPQALRDLGLSADYEVKMLASSEHLRSGSGSNPLGSPHPPLPHVIPSHRKRLGSSASAVSDGSVDGSVLSRASVNHSRPNSGLWTKPVVDTPETGLETSSSADSLVENQRVHSRPHSQGGGGPGLWQPTTPPSLIAPALAPAPVKRWPGMKRRWTVAER